MRYSQQLSVEDTNNSRALQAVGSRAALALLEGVWQFLDVIPFTEILQRKHKQHTARGYNEVIALSERIIVFWGKMVTVEGPVRLLTDVKGT